MTTQPSPDNRKAQRRIRVHIPKQYHQDPIISLLVSRYHLTVNIRAAMLGADAVGDGWFDLELQGTMTNIDAAMAYFEELGLEVWDEEDMDGW